MLILAADTSTSINTVALTDDDRILAESTVAAGRRHSERLLETVRWVLGEAAVALNSVDLLAISTGPGSFTGLRVGVATWKGLAAGAQLPLIGVPTLDDMSRLCAGADGVLCPLLDARMKEVFGAAYRYESGRREKVLPDQVGPVEDFIDALEGPVTFLGDGADLYHEPLEAALPSAVFAPPYCSVPRASTVAAEALAMLEEGANTNAGDVTPVYLRKSQAEQTRAAAGAGKS